MVEFENVIMNVNGLKAILNLPDAPKGEDIVHGLPHYNPQTFYRVDDYPACPTSWMNGSSKAGSFFFPLYLNRHLWLDFTQNSSNPKYVAIVISVQGINPVTGQPSKILRLEQYKDNCPIHNIPFKGERLCESCNYRWPPKNYLSSSVDTPLWIDGWRLEPGKIRGFLITEEMIKGVAAQLIGDERVWAIGVAFYLSRNPRPVPPFFPRPSGISTTMGMEGPLFSDATKPVLPPFPSPYVDSSSQIPSTMGASESILERYPRKKSINPIQESSKIEIAAGAKIAQDLDKSDTLALTDYDDEPVAMMFINYCSIADFNTIIAGGKSPAAMNTEGFLQNLQTGNP